MNMIPLKQTELNVPKIIMGCMRLPELQLPEIEKLIRTAMQEGIHFFDHADIYGRGRSEELFAEAIGMNPALREEMILQSKCGINTEEGTFDFSKDYILRAVDGILQRLRTDYLDILLLHRPDPLMEPDEVAEAFDELESSGKVRHFGVSNFNPGQMELLQKSLIQPLIINQLQFSLAHTPMIDSGIAFNMNADQSVNRDASVLEYCRLHDVTIQAWSPYQAGFFEGPFLGDLERFPELNETIDRIAAAYGVTNTAIAAAWILRHPANIQVVLGTTNIQRMKDACAGADIELTRKEWYDLYRAAGNMVP